MQIEKRKGKTMNAGKIALAVVGGLGVLLSAALLAGGVSLIDGEAPGTDTNGYWTTEAHHVGTPTHALASSGLDIDSDAGWFLDDGRFGSVQVSGASLDPNKDIFVGVASRTAVAAYLDGVAWDEVTDLDVDPFQVHTERHQGTGSPGAPASQPIWEASVQGTGEQTLDWDVESGDWSIVVMNADGSAGVQSDVELGARLKWLFEIGLAGILAGAFLLAVSAALMFHALRDRPSGPEAASPAAA
jgi:hypothetical protein